MTTNTANMLVHYGIYTIRDVDLMVNHLFRFSLDSVKARPAGPVYQMDGWLFRSFFTHISIKMGTITLAVILLDF